MVRKMASAKRVIADLRVFGRGYFRNVAGLFFGLIFPSDSYPHIRRYFFGKQLRDK